MSDIRADLSQYYASKVLFEQILGRDAFLRVKDSGTLTAWRYNYVKIFRAVGVAAKATVEVYDSDWMLQITALLQHGIGRVKAAKTIDEIHAAAAASFGELAFLQLGFIPIGHNLSENVPLTVINWKLNPVRTVQYVQSVEQRKTQTRLQKLSGKNVNN